MRFNSLPEHLLTGFRALKIIELPLTTQPHGIQADTPEQVTARDGGEPVKIMVGLRALTPEERGDVLAAAYARSVSKGAAGDNVEQSAMYQQNLAVYTVAAATMDPDSDRCKPCLFFGENLEHAADTIRKSPLMTDDIVIYLRERQEAFQDEVHPQRLTVKDGELYDLARRAAEDSDFFLSLRPFTRLSLLRFMAQMLLVSLEANFTDISASETDGENSKTKPLKRQSKSK
jgi:hypothetical protein